MGKGSKRYRSGNRRRKRKEQTQTFITFPSEEPMAARTGTIDSIDVSAELALLGPPGPPKDGVKWLGKPSTISPVVDCLGRVNGQTYPPRDNVPDYLKVSAKVEQQQTQTELTRKVTIVKDSTLTYPTLCLKIFVQPDPAVGAREDEARYAKMFARSHCRRAESVLEADLVIFSGGSDVDPQLYGETPHPSTYVSHKRDQVDMDLYLMCMEHGIPMMGICRGAQFLHVMNGGKLFQDVDGHNSSHPMHDIWNKKHIERVSSCHHQMVRPNVDNGMVILATAARSTERHANEKHSFAGSHVDIEAFFYRDTCCLGIQGHPEYEGYHYFTKWSLEMVEELIFNNPDLAWTDGSVLRMKSELLEERRQLKPFKPLANLPKKEVN